MASGDIMVSKQSRRSNVTSISDPNYLLNHAHIAYLAWALLAVSDAIVSSASEVKSDLNIWNKWPKLPTYPCAYCLYDICPFWQPLMPLQPPNSLGGQIWPLIWNQCHQSPNELSQTFLCLYAHPMQYFWFHRTDWLKLACVSDYLSITFSRAISLEEVLGRAEKGEKVELSREHIKEHFQGHYLWNGVQWYHLMWPTD